MRTLARSGPGREPARGRHVRARACAQRARPTTAGRPRRCGSPQARVRDPVDADAHGAHDAIAPARRLSGPGTAAASGWCVPRSRVPPAATPALTRPPAAGLPELQAWFANELAEAAPAGVTAPRPARRHRPARQPERPELDLPRAGRARPAAADRVAHLLGRDPCRRAGRRAGRAGAERAARTGSGRARARVRARPARACSTPADVTPTRRARSGRASRPSRCSTSSARTARSSSRTTGRTTSGSTPTVRPSPRTTTPATSSTCARSPRACRRRCGSPLSSPAARRGSASSPTAAPSRCT